MGVTWWEKMAILGEGWRAPAAGGVKKIVVTFGGAGLIKDFSWHAYPAGAYFCSYKSRQNTLGALPQDPDAPERPPGRSATSRSVG